MVAVLGVATGSVGAEAQTVTDIEPESGSPGSTLHIRGTGLSTLGVSNVQIGGTSITSILGQSSTLLEVEVPSGVSGPVEVTVNGVTAAETFTAVTSGSGNFSSPRNFGLPEVEYSTVEWGDFDGDGDQDLVLIGDSNGFNTNGGLLTRIYENDTENGNGFVQAYSLTGMRQASADWGDYDNDGDLDLAITGNTEGFQETKIYRNDTEGNDGFTAIGASSITDVSQGEIKWGDYNSDGNLDLVVTGVDDDFNDTAEIYTGDGNGSFNARGAPLTGVSDGSADWGDFDGDGDLDLIITGSDNTGDTESATLYENDVTNNNGFIDQGSAGLVGVENSAADVADIDGDDDLDLIVMGADSESDGPTASRTEVYENDGSGNFTPLSVGIVDLTGGEVEWGDADGDGDPDIAITGDDFSSARENTKVYENDLTNENGFTSVGTEITDAYESSSGWGDYDGDGRLDLAVTGKTENGRTTVIHQSQSFGLIGTTPEAKARAVPTNSSIDLAFNADIASQTNLADKIVVRGSHSGPIDGTVSGTGASTLTYNPSQDFEPGETVAVTSLGTIENTAGGTAGSGTTFRFTTAAQSGPGAFPLLKSVSTNEDGARAVAVADLDGDGDQDLVVGSDQAGSVTRYMNQGNATFGSGTTVNASTLKNPTDVALADIDGQNGLDIVVSLGNGSESATDEVLWYPNDSGGDGAFGTVQTVASSSDDLDDPRSVATGDLDGDGDLDVVVGSRENSVVRWYENDGSGGFTEQDVTTSTSYPRDVAVGDIDGNGTPDVAWMEDGSNNQGRWISNDGTGTFSDRQPVGGGDLNPVDVELADVDGNGNLDAVIAAAGADAVKVVFDNGAGDLSAASTALSTTVDSVSAVDVADVTGDGTLDLLATAGQGNALYAFTNDGNGNFSTPGPFETSANQATDVVAADVDGDGALDPVATSYGDNTVAFYPNIQDSPRIYVDADVTSGVNYGSSWDNALTSLQVAFDMAEAGDEIWIAEGTYTPDPGGTDETRSFTITGALDGLKVYGGFDGTESAADQRDPQANRTILSGDVGGDDTQTNGVTERTSDISGANSNHVLYLDGTTSGPITASTRIDGVTVTAGQGSRGGGLYCQADGGECSPTLARMVFAGNLATDDGGALHNNALNGGVSSSKITESLFVGNKAEDDGGAVLNEDGGNPLIINVVFSRNRASGAGNTNNGGAIYNSGGSPTITNVTFSENQADASGGALYVAGSSNPTVTNSILWGNGSSEVGDIDPGDSDEATFSHSIVEGSGGSSGWDTSVGTDNGNNLDTDPLFLAPANDNVRLNWASPAIDAGDGNALPSGVTTDLDGASRTQGPAVDIGAYEGGAEPSGVSTLRVDASKTTGGSSGGAWDSAYGTLQAALGAARNEAAASGDLSFTEITVAAGTYYPDEGPGIPAGKQDTSFVITGNEDGLQLRGGYPAGGGTQDPETNVTVLSGDIDGGDTDPDNDGIIEDANPNDDDTVENLNGSNAYHVLVLDGGGFGYRSNVSANVTSSTVLDGVTVTAGNAGPGGREGGGLYCDGGGSGNACSPTITDVTFAGNNAARGGAVYTNGSSGTSAPTIANTEFVGNSAVNPIDIAEGGALFNFESSPEITNAVFRNNMVNGDGGAIFNSSSTPSIVNATFVGNSAVNGGNGGALVVGGATTITNATFTGNTASGGDGGAIRTGSDPTVTNSILWGNTASTNDEVGGGTPTFEHSLVQGSGGSSSWDTGLGTDNGGNIDADPQFFAPSDVDGPDNRFATSDDGIQLLSRSPAVDAGNDASLPTDAADLDGDDNTSEQLPVDLTGAARVQDQNTDGTSTVNMGAYEVTTDPLEITNRSPDRNAIGGSRSLSEITVTFGAELDGTTIGPESLRLYGGQAGRIAEAGGGISIRNGNTLVFEPARSFRPGEDLTVSIAGDIASTSGRPVGTAQTFSFSAATDSGPGTFPATAANLSGVEDGSVDWGDFDEDGDLDLLVVGDGGDFTPTATIYENTESGFSPLNAGLAGTYYAAAAWGDYDNDGDLDVVITGDDGNGVTATIYENDVENENGFTAINAGLTGVEKGAVDWGDYDGDGDQDLLVTGDNSAGTSTATIYENDVANGNGFSAVGAGLTGVYNGDVDWGDYDADGDLDLVITGIDAGETSSTNIYENTGNGNFSALNSSLPDRQEGSVAWGDYDGDGDLDLAFSGAAGADGTTLTTAIVENVDSGGFSPLGAGLTPVRQSAIEWADVDGDSDPDLIVSGSGGDGPTTTIYENLGSGNFSAFGASLTGQSGGGVDVGDVDGDGDADLVVSGTDESSTPRVQLYKQATPLQVTDTSPARNATNVDTSLGELAVTFNKPLDAASVTDGDTEGRVFGRQSGAVTGTFEVDEDDGSELEFVPDEGPAFVPGEEVVVSVLGGSLAAADGVLFGATETRLFTAQAKAGPSSFPVNRVITESAVEAKWVQPADLDGDGDLDVLSASEQDDTIAWYENTDGDGSFGAAQTLSTTADGVQEAHAADVDGDGDLDVVAALENDGTVAWYENTDGAGSFGTQQTIATGLDAPTTIATADVDGDGDLDVFSGLGVGDQVLWYENTDGQGSFAPGQGISSSVDFVTSVEAADVDGDGDPDLLSTSLADNKIAWYENTDGAGNFGAQQVISTSASGATSARAADLNGDGDLDVLSTTTNGNTVGWYENTDGAGSFGSEQVITTVGSPESARAADVDGDGDLDVLSASRNGGIAWFDNDGSGSFGARKTIATRPDEVGDPQSVAAADVDGDGDLDALSASISDDKIAWYPNSTIAPQVVTEAASSVADSSFAAEAAVNPGGRSTTVTFEYGEDMSFGTDSTVTATTSLTGDDTTAVSATISGLDPGTTYNYRVVASSGDGTTTGDLQATTTNSALPQATAEPASAISTNQATLNATVNPGGASTTADALFGRASGSAQYPFPLGTVESDLDTDSSLSITTSDTLQPSTEYRYWVEASNSAGTAESPDTTYFSTDNVAPAAADDSETIDEDSTVTIDVLANDSDVGQRGFGGGLDSSTVTVVSTPSNGTTSINAANGAVTYTPNQNFNGSDSFTYTVDDDAGTVSGEATVSLTISSVNDPPVVATNEELVLDEGADSTLSAVNLAVTDVEDGPSGLQYTVDTVPANGELLLSGSPLAQGGTFAQVDVNDGRLVYQHDGSETTSDSFEFTVEDQSGDGRTVSGTFSMDVTPVNDPPTLVVPADQTIDEDGSISGLPVSISDPETPTGDLSLTATSQDTDLVPSANLSASTDADGGTLSLTPAPDSNGAATIALTVSDGEKQVSGSVDVTVTAVNDTPLVATNATLELDEGADSTLTATTLQVTDVESGPANVTYTLQSAPSNGQLHDTDAGTALSAGATFTQAVLNSGTIEYRHDGSETTVDSFTFAAEDSNGATTDATAFSISVTPVDDPPVVASSGPFSVVETASAGTSIGDLDATDGDGSDPDGNVSYAIVDGNDPDGDQTGAFSIDSATGQIQVDNPAEIDFEIRSSYGLTIEVDDGVNTTSQSLTVNVMDVAPAISAQTLPDPVSEAAATGTVVGTIATSDDQSSRTVAIRSGNPNRDGDGTPAFAVDAAGELTLADSADIDYEAATSEVLDVVVSDGSSADSATVTVEIADANESPTVASLGPRTIDEDSTAGPIALTVSDPETPVGDLTITGASDNPALLPDDNVTVSTSQSGTTLRAVPRADSNGTATVTVTVDDGTNQVTSSFDLTVNPVNDGPTVATNALLSIDEEADSTITAASLEVTDVESGPNGLTYTVETAPSNGLLYDTGAMSALADGQTFTQSDLNTGTIEYRHDGTQTTADSFTFSVADPDGASTDTKAFNIEITPINDAPTVAAPADQSVSEDTPLGPLNVSIGDEETDTANLALTASADAPDLFPSDSIATSVGSDGGTVRLAPLTDSTGTAQVTLTVADGNGKTATASFEVTVTSVNDRPTISAPADQTIDEDEAITDLSVSIEDVETPTTELTLTAASQNLNVVPDSSLSPSTTAGGGRLSLKPAPDSNGTATIDLTVSDGDKQAGASLEVTVEAVNDTPRVVTNAGRTVVEGADSTITEAQLRTDDVESGPDVLTYTLVEAPTSGELFDIGAGSALAAGQTFTQTDLNDETIEYRHDGSEGTSDSFSFEVGDPQGATTGTQSFAITVTPRNEPPVAEADPDTTDEDTPVTIDVLANDTDPDGNLNPESVEVLDAPGLGEATVTDGGAITYTPETNENGTDDFRYRVADDSSAADTAVVTLTITPVNDRPEALADTGRMREGGSVEVALLENDADVEGRLDTSSVEVISGPYAGQATVARGRLTYEPSVGFSGRDSLRYRVEDEGRDGSSEQPKADTATVHLEVAAVALASASDTADAGAVQVGREGAPVEVTLRNVGEAALSGVSVGIEGPQASAFQLAGDSGEETLSEGEARTVQVVFMPEVLGRREARLTAESEGGAADTTKLVGRGARLTAQAPAPTRGEAAKVTIGVEGGFAPTEAMLYAREGGTAAYEALALEENPQDGEQEGEPLTLSATVPDTLATPRGIDYYAVLSAGAGTLTVPSGGVAAARERPRHLPVSFQELRAPVSFAPEGYQMVTVPAEPEGDGGVKGALEAAFGPYDRAEWRLLRWDASASEEGSSEEGADGGTRGSYREYPQVGSLESGEAFWLVTAGGDSLTLRGGQTPDATEAQEVPLEAGWNQVGSPFGYGVPWDTVRTASGLSKSEVDGPTAWADTGYTDEREMLEAWEGYFVWVAERDTLVVPPVGPPATGTSRERLQAEAGPKALRGSNLAEEGGLVAPMGTEKTASGKNGSSNNEGYTMQVKVLTGEGNGGRVWLGLRPEAKAGRDALDFAQAPPIGGGLRLWAAEEVSGRVVPHAGSFKPSGHGSAEEKGQAWRLTLHNRSEESREARLGVESEGERPDGYRRYVLDLNAGRRVAPGERLVLQGGEARGLKVIVGTEAFAKAESEEIGLKSFENELRGNYPNPFQRRTQIGYTLGEAQEVTVQVYNVLGQRVRTLVRGESQEVGLHRVTWAGENRYGEPVGSGVYFLRLRAGQFEATRKMVLVR